MIKTDDRIKKTLYKDPGDCFSDEKISESSLPRNKHVPIADIIRRVVHLYHLRFIKGNICCQLFGRTDLEKVMSSFGLIMKKSGSENHDLIGLVGTKDVGNCWFLGSVHFKISRDD